MVGDINLVHQTENDAGLQTISSKLSQEFHEVMNPFHMASQQNVIWAYESLNFNPDELSGMSKSSNSPDATVHLELDLSLSGSAPTSSMGRNESLPSSLLLESIRVI